MAVTGTMTVTGVMTVTVAVTGSGSGCDRVVIAVDSGLAVAAAEAEVRGNDCS